MNHPMAFHAQHDHATGLALHHSTAQSLPIISSATGSLQDILPAPAAAGDPEFPLLPNGDIQLHFSSVPPNCNHSQWQWRVTKTNTRKSGTYVKNAKCLGVMVCSDCGALRKIVNHTNNGSSDSTKKCTTHGCSGVLTIKECPARQIHRVEADGSYNYIHSGQHNHDPPPNVRYQRTLNPMRPAKPLMLSIIRPEPLGLSSVPMLQKKRILIGTTGSVASVKLPMLINELRKIFGDFVEIRVVATTPSLHFFKKEDISVPVVTDVDEWNAWSQMGDPVLHIELRNWADIMVVAPLDANTLAKLAAGICDNLLTCTLRAWDPSRPVVVCPAMNTHMWTHPFTQKHLDVLAAEASYIIIPPITKTLACGDTGIGAMENVDRVAQRIYEILEG